MSHLHDFTLRGLNNKPEINFAEFQGKKIMLVNTASACGYTPQYAQLEELYQEFKNKLVIIACPCNQFGNQESAPENEIAQFCELNYGVTFPITEKIDVRGTHPHPLYRWLTAHTNTEVSWNFQKYLFDEKGNFEAMFPPATPPMSEEVLEHLE